MYCGLYGRVDGVQDDTFFYIGINFHWRGNYLGLPQLPKGKEWALYATTDPQEYPEYPDGEAVEQNGGEIAEVMQEIYVSPRSVAIYITKDCPAADQRKTARTAKKQSRSAATPIVQKEWE